MTAININWFDEYKNNPDKWVNCGQEALLQALEKGSIKQLKEIFELVEINIQDLKEEFEQNIKDDKDFEKEWYYKEEKKQENAFYEWLQDVHLDTIRNKAEEQIFENYVPMMNYGHLLDIKPEEEDILRVILNTNCNVMQNTETDEYFIVLTGGGMDLSQDIGLSYIWLQKWIPEDLIKNICSQEGFSISKENFKILKKEILEQSKRYAGCFSDLNKRWSEK